ncbi:MAG: hypothetical protein JO306_00635 [Gemmatimonadetes bacterium]|nr:hypothetical protein [Gemmatimonadota bacterium]
MAGRWIAPISALAGIVSCIAAALVVPEVRCAIGLTSNIAQACPRREASSQGVAPGFAPGAPALSAPSGMTPADVDASVLRIRARFQEVEREMAAGQYDSLRKEVTGLGGDSAYATIYVAAGQVPKIRARVYQGDVRTSYQAWYDGGRLVFLYRTASRLLPSGPSEFEEQRFYFDGGTMVRWLDAARRDVPAGSAEYVDAEQTIRRVGDGLIAGATSQDAVIRL